MTAASRCRCGARSERFEDTESDGGLESLFQRRLGDKIELGDDIFKRELRLAQRSFDRDPSRTCQTRQGQAG